MSLKFNPEDTHITTLGEAKVDNPIPALDRMSTKTKILYSPLLGEGKVDIEQLSKYYFEAAAVQKKIYFDPAKVRAAIVTCGGLCPGLNNVIRSIVLSLHHLYGVKTIYGVKYGFQGLVHEYAHEFLDLTPDVVRNIHEQGGSILGSSRGEQNITEIVDSLERQNISALFIIGGDGSLHAAHRINKEVLSRNLKISVIGVPKTIDNDISCVSQSFGFETAVDKATEAIGCAHTEAISYPNGIGLVKLMGRESGFIASTAAVAKRDVNFVLVPEVDFELEGKNGLFANLEARLEARGYAVIVVAEGAGEHLMQQTNKKDASGNKVLQDVGVFLKKQINDHFKKKKQEINLKYIDPSYIIRSVVANTTDGLFCGMLGQYAVHAAMAGKTGLLISYWHGVYCYVPFPLAIKERKKIHPYGQLWRSVLETTGQPWSMTNDPQKS